MTILPIVTDLAAVIVFMCAGLWWTVGMAFGMVQP